MRIKRPLIYTIVLLMLSSPAYAEGGSNGLGDSSYNSGVNSGGVVNPSPKVGIPPMVEKVPHITNRAEGGEARAEGGNATGGSSSVEGVAGGSVNFRQRRQAPAVGLVVPQSTMACSKGFGWGGSNETGSMLLGWSWLQRDCMALQQFELLVNLEMPEAASKAYCSRKMFYFPFDNSQEKCQAAIVESLLAMQSEEVEVAEVKKHLPKVSPLQRYFNSQKN